MSRASQWRVWSRDDANNAWLEVDRGSEREMRAGAERRTATAKRFGIEAEYVALPVAELPERGE